jgi:hypothetical protein
LLALVLLPVLAGGCHPAPQKADYASMSARFFMEARSGEQGLPIQLP